LCHFLQPEKNVLSEMNIVIFDVVFQLYFSFKTKKILEFCSPTHHRQSFLTLVFSEYEEGIRADSPRIVLT